MDDIMVSPDITVISSRIIKYKDDNGQEMPIANTYQERKQQPSDHYPVRAVISTEGFF